MPANPPDSPPDEPIDLRADPLGGAIFGAVSVCYWRRGLPSRSIGGGAEDVTRRVLAALAAVARPTDPAVQASDATAAVLATVADHVAAIGLPEAQATDLQAALARVIGRVIILHTSPAPETQH